MNGVVSLALFFLCRKAISCLCLSTDGEYLATGEVRDYSYLLGHTPSLNLVSGVSADLCPFLLFLVWA